MRIVHVSDTFQPQLGYQDFFLAREQLRCNHDVAVVTADRYFRFPNYESTVAPILGPRFIGSGRFYELGIPVIRLPVRFEIGTKLWLKGLISVLTSLEPDVVHVHNISNFTATRIAVTKSRVGGRLLYDDHMHYSILRKRGPVTRAAQSIQRAVFGGRIASAGDAFVAICEETADLMVRHYGIPASRIVVIPLGVDVEQFAPTPAVRREVRRGLGLQDHEVVFTYTGKVIRAKGPDILVEAALHLQRAGHPVRVLLVGGGDEVYVREIRSMGSRAELARLLVQHPPVPNAELCRLMNAGDAGVWPREESMSMLEAASCGLPIVIKESDGIRDRVAAGNGLMYREADVADLARCLTELLDRERREQMGRRGRQLVVEHYSWKRISERFVALYEGSASADVPNH